MWVFLEEEGIRKEEKKLNELLFDKAAAACPREFRFLLIQGRGSARSLFQRAIANDECII